MTARDRAKALQAAWEAYLTSCAAYRRAEEEGGLAAVLYHRTRRDLLAARVIELGGF